MALKVQALFGKGTAKAAPKASKPAVKVAKGAKSSKVATAPTLRLSDAAFRPEIRCVLAWTSPHCVAGVELVPGAYLVPTTRKAYRTCNGNPCNVQGWFGGSGGSQTSLDKWYGECCQGFHLHFGLHPLAYAAYVTRRRWAVGPAASNALHAA